MSYMERTFSEWLTSRSVDFQQEVRFHNPTINKTYFVDFLFEDRKVIIELDGTQHLKTKEADELRDHFIASVYGYTILRISHKEYRAKSKLAQVCSLLGLARETGLEPAQNTLEECGSIH